MTEEKKYERALEFSFDDTYGLIVILESSIIPFESYRNKQELFERYNYWMKIATENTSKPIPVEIEKLEKIASKEPGKIDAKICYKVMDKKLLAFNEN